MFMYIMDSEIVHNVSEVLGSHMLSLLYSIQNS